LIGSLNRWTNETMYSHTPYFVVVSDHETLEINDETQTCYVLKLHYKYRVSYAFNCCVYLRCYISSLKIVNTFHICLQIFTLLLCCQIQCTSAS